MNSNILNFSNNQLSFTNHITSIDLDTMHDEEGLEINYLFMRSNIDTDNKITFSFDPTKYIFPIGNESTNVLTELLSIDEKNTKAFNMFFKKYGFLFPLDEEKTARINYTSIKIFVKHLKLTCELLAETNKAKNINYKKMYNIMTRLLLAPPCEITIGKKSYSTCTHPLYSLLNELDWHNLNKFPEVTTPVIGVDQLPDYSKIEVYDSLSGDGYVTFQEYDWEHPYKFRHSFIGLDELIYASRFRHLMLNLPHNPSSSLRTIVELYYHLEDEDYINIISCDDIDTLNCLNDNNWENRLSDWYKERIIQVARIISSEEIEFVLKNLQPVFNAELFEAHWNIPDLYTALYLSLLFSKKGLLITRTCQNTNCNSTFFVPSTNNKKIYCCDSCAKAMASRNYRLKQKKNRNI